MKLLKRITVKKCFDPTINTDVKPYNAARAVLLDDNNMIAVLYLRKYEFYTLPGGGIDHGETAVQGLAREMLEETGCNCEIIHHLGIIEENSLTYNWWVHSECFLARIKGEKGTPSLTQRELDEEPHVQWHSMQEALRLIETQNIDNMPNVESARNAVAMKIIQERDITMLHEAMAHIVTSYT